MSTRCCTRRFVDLSVCTLSSKECANFVFPTQAPIFKIFPSHQSPTDILICKIFAYFARRLSASCTGSAGIGRSLEWDLLARR